MSEVTELLENMEHAGHGGHEEHGEAHGGGHGGKKSIGKNVGITMAVLGVLLALCSALVGGTRTELIATMVQRTNVALKYQAVSTKFRLLQANLLQMNALLPSDPAKFKELEVGLKEAQARVTPGTDVANATTVIANFHDQLLMTVVPTTSDLKRFVVLARAYKAEATAALHWDESYEDAIAALENGGEHYEWGMLAAEIGIVIASIALLLGSRPAWFVAIGLAVTCVVVMVVTHLDVRARLQHAEAEIEEGQDRYETAASEEKAEAADEALFKSIEAMP
jgi:hypothetical protein